MRARRFATLVVAAFILTGVLNIMSSYSTTDVTQAKAVPAPDGSTVRPLLALAGGGMACFDLAAGCTTRAVVHRTIEELWFVRAGSGELWRKQDGAEDITSLTAGVCVSIPLGTHFQFRAAPERALSIVGVTMPPWPGDDEAQVVAGPWMAHGRPASDGG
ncbi:MAG: mannose-6-phosphate isomerase-like protein (cupin superfamily) [Gammaproteobacteria bacterium]